MAHLYINLPVTDLIRSTEFYSALGFQFDPDFSNEQTSAMVYDETLSVILLTHNFYQKFLHKKRIANAHQTAQVLNALQFESRKAVDDFFEKAISAGGKKTIDTYDYEFMYGRDFEDPDGHIWEAFWIDMSHMPKRG